MLRAIIASSSLAHAAAGASYQLAHSGGECMSEDHNLTPEATAETVDVCAQRCAAMVNQEYTGADGITRTATCRFFIFGTGAKVGRCYAEFTTSRDCPEGFENDEYDFYELVTPASPMSPAPPPPPPSASPISPPPPPPSPPSPPPAPFTLQKDNAECSSLDTDLGMQPTVEACYEVCMHTDGCKFFIFGKGYKLGRCFWEHTETTDCAEGWEVDEYDFYEVPLMKMSREPTSPGPSVSLMLTSPGGHAI